MRTALTATLFALLAFLLLPGWGLFASEKKAVPPLPEKSVVRSEVTMTGVIEISEEDDSGKVVSVSLSCMNDLGQYDYYSIENKGKGRELLKQIGETVTVTGQLRTDKAKHRALRVARYKVIRDEGAVKEPDDL